MFALNLPMKWGVLYIYIYAFRPICCLHFGPVFKRKTAFWALLGEIKKIWGEQKKQNLNQILVHFWGAIFTIQLDWKWDFWPKCRQQIGLMYIYICEYLLQSETWLVHEQVREPHLSPPVHMNFRPLIPVLKGTTTKVHTNRWAQMWFANLLVNQPCFRFMPMAFFQAYISLLRCFRKERI